LPEVDLLIRTGGFKRLSNFILWQISYAELYFTDILWPNFNKKSYFKAIEWYQGIDRKFGKS
jgi:undecaprenyl diphosphate synthase